MATFIPSRIGTTTMLEFVQFSLNDFCFGVAGFEPLRRPGYSLYVPNVAHY